MPRPQPAESTVKEARDMYRMGYRQAMTEMYADNDPERIAYGVDYYGRLYDHKYSAYDRGITDALTDRIARREQ